MTLLATTFFLSSCENEAPIDALVGVELSQQAFNKNAPCDNSTNPTCAFVLPMDHEVAAPILAERALRQCPQGPACVFTGDQTTVATKDWCPEEISSGNCSETKELYYSLNPIISADDLNDMVCYLTDQVRNEEFVRKNKIESLTISTGEHPENGLTYYYYVVSVTYTEINPRVPVLCQ